MIWTAATASTLNVPADGPTEAASEGVKWGFPPARVARRAIRRLKVVLAKGVEEWSEPA